MHFHVDPRTKERERVKGVQGKKKSLDCSSFLEFLTSVLNYTYVHKVDSEHLATVLSHCLGRRHECPVGGGAR